MTNGSRFQVPAGFGLDLWFRLAVSQTLNLDHGGGDFVSGKTMTDTGYDLIETGGHR